MGGFGCTKQLIFHCDFNIPFKDSPHGTLFWGRIGDKLIIVVFGWVVCYQDKLLSPAGILSHTSDMWAYDKDYIIMCLCVCGWVQYP